MQYRKLGKTGLDVSVIGLGCGELGTQSTDYAVRIVQRALDLGVNYIDTARAYGDSEIKIGIALKGQRQRAFVSTKTGAKTRDEAWRQINESLERLQMDYVDNCHLHEVYPGEDAVTRLLPDGPVAALIRAKEEGLTRHIGITSHVSGVLIEALKRFPFEIILVPMNIIEREPLDQLIPLCQEKGVGVTIMKPLATGIIPARLALKWLANQPIATAVPGITSIEQIEEDALVGHLPDFTLTPQEEQRAAALKAEWEHRRCRLCGACLPCEKGIAIHLVLGSDVMADHYHALGREAFATFAWSREAIERDLDRRRQTIAQIEACDHCGNCEAKCPYGLPIMGLLPQTLPIMRDMMSIYERLLQG